MKSPLAIGIMTAFVISTTGTSAPVMADQAADVANEQAAAQAAEARAAQDRQASAKDAASGKIVRSRVKARRAARAQKQAIADETKATADAEKAAAERR